MPIWLRTFTYNEIKKYNEEQSAAIQKASKVKNSNQKTLIDKDGKINTPEFLEASKPYKGKTSYK